MKLTIYTTIYGKYDTLKEPLFTHEDITYLCFTDQDLESKNWEIIKLENKLLSLRRQSRIPKILSHMYIEDEISLCIDGSCYIYRNPFNYIKRYLKENDFVLSMHPNITCIYEQTELCIRKNKANEEIAREQIKRYEEDGFPRNIHSVDAKVMLRRMTPAIKQFEKIWWNEYIIGCQRDQTAFGYAAWKEELDYGIFKWKGLVKRTRHLINEKIL